MPCWSCQSKLSPEELVNATEWDLCRPCEESLRALTRGALPAHATDEAEHQADAALAGALDPALRQPPAPHRRVIAVYGADEQLLTSCAADVEIGNLMDLALAVGAGRRLILEEIEP